MISQICSAADKISCHFGTFFVLLPPQPEKSNFKNQKKTMEISSFYTSASKIMIMLYFSLKMIHNGLLLFFILSYFSYFYLSDQVEIVSIFDLWKIYRKVDQNRLDHLPIEITTTKYVKMTWEFVDIDLSTLIGTVESVGKNKIGFSINPKSSCFNLKF